MIWKNLDINLIKHYYLDEKYTIQKIADITGYKVSTIYSILKRYDWNRTRGKAATGVYRKELDLDELSKLYIEGKSSDYLAELYGLSKWTIQNRLRALGILRNKEEASFVSLLNPERKIQLAKARDAKPNKQEICINDIVQEMFPNLFIFNSKKENVFSICTKEPDWYCKDNIKKLIEYNGCYYHSCNDCYPQGCCINGRTSDEIHLRDKIKLSIYEKYGFKVLVIWAHDDYSMIISKLENFIHGGG